MIDAQRDADTTLYALKRILNVPDAEQIELADQQDFFHTPSASARSDAIYQSHRTAAQTPTGTLFRRAAAEIRRLVHASSAVIVSNLRVRAEGTSSINLARSLVGSDDLFRSFTMFNPLFNRADFVESIRTLSA